MKYAPHATATTLILFALFTLGLGSPGLAQEESSEEGQDSNEQEEAEEKTPRPRKRTSGSLPYAWSEQFQWRSIGPANMGGRVTSIAVHPGDDCTYWIGTAGGGLLKTTNNGVNYEHLLTDQGSSSIGVVEVARSNPDIVWVGTGENNPRNSVSWGDGVYKSTNGGKTWWHMGLKDSFQVSSIVIHPENPDVVYVGALGRLWGDNEERGLFKTTDGGETWEKVLFIDEKTGVIDICVKPDDPETLLVATYERARDIYCSNDPAKKWGSGGGIHRTTDGGATFVEVTEGLPSCDKGRIGLDWYASDPNIVYAIVESERITQEPPDAAYMGVRGEDADVGARMTEITEDSAAETAGLEKDDIIIRMAGETVLSWSRMTDMLVHKKAQETVELEVVRGGESVLIELTFGNRPEREDPTDDQGRPRPGPFHGGLGGQRENIQEQQGEDGVEFGGIYRSNDAGKTWKRINSVNPRPMYYSEIRVDPSDNNNIYVLGTSLYRSSDGGTTFTGDGHDGSVHVDHHAMWVDPDDGRHIILGNDGGIYVTWDRMESWDHHNHVSIGQFYNIACDPTPDYMVYGGLQDNGSWGGPNRVSHESGPTNTDWFRVGGGDGFVCRVDVNDPDLVYYESQNGGMGRRNLRTGEGGSVRPSSTREQRNRFNWNTPFLLSIHNSRIHYSAGNYVFRSLDRGNKARKISPEITLTDRGSATSLAESRFNSDILYVGTDDGALWTTRDGGREWVDLFALNEPEEEEPENAEEAKPEDDQEGDGGKDPAKAARVSFSHEPRDDAIVGVWSCRASGEGIEGEDQGKFTLDLAVDSEGRLTGFLNSEIGEGDVRELRWNAEKQALDFEFEANGLMIRFDAQLTDETLEGTIAAAGGAFDFKFTGTRTQQPKQEQGDPGAEVSEDTEEDPERAQDRAGRRDRGRDRGSKDKPKKKKFIKDTIDQLLPGRFYVSSITVSRHKQERVYVTFDAHRSDDTRPYLFRSDDQGESWESLRENLPDSAGSVRDLDEDIENKDVLYLGTEHHAYVSVDGGESWTELGAGLPTVPVHDFAQHPTSGELIAGTHGRSVWILDVSTLRQVSEKSMEASVHLYDPRDMIRWRSRPSRGASGTRRFVGSNPDSTVVIYYSLDSRARDITLEVHNSNGEVVRELIASGDKGLHRVDWSMRRGSTSQEGRGNRRSRRSSRIGIGTYFAVLTADGETLRQEFEVLNDPNEPDQNWLRFEEEAEVLEEIGLPGAPRRVR